MVSGGTRERWLTEGQYTNLDSEQLILERTLDAIFIPILLFLASLFVLHKLLDVLCGQFLS